MSTDDDARASAEASDWFAKMRGPNADEPGLAGWRAAHPANDAAYSRLLRRWDQAAFSKRIPSGQGRDLDRVAAWHRKPVARYAAAAALIAVVGGIGTLTINRPTTKNASDSAMQFASATGQLRQIDLADGSKITLDTNSAVRVRVSQNERRARLMKGRARFTVAGSVEPAFVIDVGQGSISTQAAEFDVGVSDKFIKVALWRGELEVSRAGSPAAPAASQRLVAGQQVAFSFVGGSPTPTSVRSGERDWTRGMLSFDGTRLADAVAALNRYNATQIVLATPELAERKITGAFRATDPAAFARATAAMLHLTIRLNADGSIVLSPERKT